MVDIIDIALEIEDTTAITSIIGPNNLAIKID
jgi:hypothetical protein